MNINKTYSNIKEDELSDTYPALGGSSFEILSQGYHFAINILFFFPGLFLIKNQGLQDIRPLSDVVKLIAELTAGHQDTKHIGHHRVVKLKKSTTK